MRLAAFQSAFLQLVAPAIARVAREHPDVRVEASEIEVEEAVPLLRLGHLDVVVGDEYEGVPRPVWADLVRERLLDEQVRVMIPAGHELAGRERVALDRLAGAVWVGARSSTGHREMHLRVCRERGGFEPDIRFHSDDLAIQLEMVRTTGACGLLPDLVLRRGIEGVATPLVAGGGIGREIFMRHPRRADAGGGGGAGRARLVS